MSSNHLLLHCPLLLLPSIFPSIRVFSNELALWIRGPKYWSFSFSISPSNEYSGLISFRIYWLDLLAVQGTLKSLPQHHSLKVSILQPLEFNCGRKSEELIWFHFNQMNTSFELAQGNGSVVNLFTFNHLQLFGVLFTLSWPFPVRLFWAKIISVS